MKQIIMPKQTCRLRGFLVCTLCFLKSFGDSFVVVPSLKAVTLRDNVKFDFHHHSTSPLFATQDDEDTARRQQEIDEMMEARLISEQREEDEKMNLYNAAPLFTGVIITLFSLLGTGYLVSDPNSQRKKILHR